MALTKCKECGGEVSTRAAKCPHCGSPAKKKTSIFTWLVVVLLLFWGIGYMSHDSSEINTAAGGSAQPDQKLSDLVKLEYEWQKVGFNNVMEADFTIQNDNEVAIKDIEIECTHFAKSGTKIDSNRKTIYDAVPAKGKKKFSKFNMGFIHTQADKTACRIVKISA
jgi:hypothetical protein